MDFGIIFIIAASVIGLIMAWGVGANDLANIMSTTMASKSVSLRQAIIIAVVFEFAGALLGGAHVTHTIRGEIINTALFVHHPRILILGMTASLLSGMSWMLFASYIGMPVSITNAIVGAIIGFGTIVLGVNAVHWHMINTIALCWLISPAVSAMLAYFVFVSIKRLILVRGNPVQNAKMFCPFFFFVVGIVLAIMIVLKDLSHMGILLTEAKRVWIMVFGGALLSAYGWYIGNRRLKAGELTRAERFQYVEGMFGVLMGFTACAMVFAHGSNDVAIATGPVSAVYTLVKNGGDLAASQVFPTWLLVAGCFMVVLGLFFYGRKVIETVGAGITDLTPSRAFSATIAAAVTVLCLTSAGIPVSATQTLVGGVFGVGMARGIGALNLRVVRNIILSWVVTVPLAALLAILYFELLKAFVNVAI